MHINTMEKRKKQRPLYVALVFCPGHKTCGMLTRLFPGPELGHNFRFALCIALTQCKQVTKESLANTGICSHSSVLFCRACAEVVTMLNAF